MSPLHSSIIQFIASDFNPSVVDIDNADLIQALTEFDDMYATDESVITDGQYDALREYANVIMPTHKYFLGVGSEVRGGKVDLPFEMGSLNQVQIGDIAQWVKDNKLENEEHIVSDKMDGTSALLVYDDTGKAQIAYSRGDGVQGADISRHIFKIKNVPTQCNKIPDGGITVRAEVELTESAFAALRAHGVTRHGGNQHYKNARNMVAGLMNSKTIPAICYDYLTVITYEVVGIPADKKTQMQLLAANGFKVVDYTIAKGKDLTDDNLAKLLTSRRENIDYAIDGLVIEVNDLDARERMNPTKETLNPGYAIKYKVADADNHAVATVTGVSWNISKHGYLKPQVNIKPVDLVGVTISNCTGFNARYIYDNKIQPGTKINITRSGDVIPFCTGVAEPGKLK